MDFYLPSLPMMKILSYLDAFSLLQVAQVNKNWNALASNDLLWRKFCQKRWFSCDTDTLQLWGTKTWKQFFVHRTCQEHAKTRAKPEDFTYVEIPLEFGVRECACYISGSGLTRKGQGNSVVCMVTSENRISTWDIHEGVMTWASPVQPIYIKLLTTLPEMHMAITVDIESTMKLWDCHNSDALVTNSLSLSLQFLEAVLTKDGPIVLAGDTLGSLYIFRIPDLHRISKLLVFPYGIDDLHCSPQNKWVFLSNNHPYIFPKVFYMSSLLRTPEFSAPVSTILDFSLCERAIWTPRMEDRITLISTRVSPHTTKFVTFDMKLEEIGDKIIVKGHLIASFSLQDYQENPEWIGINDQNISVCATESSLLLFSMNGLHLQTFQYCHEEIESLYVDPLHVIVIFNDGSLDVYAWEERSPLLRKCYRLQNMRHRPRYNLVFKTLCDNVSIIGVMRNSSGPWFLMACTLSSAPEN